MLPYCIVPETGIRRVNKQIVNSGSLLIGSGIVWLGVIAAASGWRWTSQTIAGAAWGDAWLYTNLMLGLVVFVTTPMMAATATTDAATAAADLIWHIPAMLLAAAPILATAGWLSQIHLEIAINTVLVQLALAMFMLGISVWVIRLKDIFRAMVTGLCTGAFLLGPGIWLIQTSIFPWLSGGLWSNWIALFPTAMILHACHAQCDWQSLYWMAGIYATIGILLFCVKSSKSVICRAADWPSWREY